ncbi:MAG: hypothetical protein ACM3YN_03520 [Parcubacteria group bacterium]
MNPPNQHGPTVSDKEEAKKRGGVNPKMREVTEDQAREGDRGAAAGGGEFGGADAGGGEFEDLGRGGD